MMNIWRSPILALILLFIVPIKSVGSQVSSSADDSFTCPQDLNKLTSLLLKDLPNYSNRVIQRTQTENRKAGIRNFIIVASRPEFEPLDLPRIQYNTIDNQDPQLVFFTVLERQYNNNKLTNIQTYHWLFLTQTENGWQTVLMFSRFGNAQATKPPAPPRETTNGIIGRGVQLWLKDCREGRIKP
ncbi:MAG: hypothetical protein ACFCAD_22665 [Pleurocapsa sp.]